MLLNIDTKKEITQTPHKNEYDLWMSRLTKEDILAIKTEICGRIEGDEIATAGWIPGSDWSNTPFQPIYEKACRFDVISAGKCFGLMVWQVIMEHEDRWAFGRYELNNIPIESMTYFKVRPNAT